MITSKDGSRQISVEEFDRLFDEGSDQIDQFLDLSRARHGGRREGSGRKPTGKVNCLVRLAPDVRERAKKTAKKRGMTFSAYVESCL